MMKRLISYIKKFYGIFKQTKPGQVCEKIYRILFLMSKLSSERKIPALAQSLAYTTILSLVPIVAIFFAVLGRLNTDEAKKEQVKQFISKYFFPDHADNIFVRLESMTQDSLAFGAVGLPTLVLAGILLYVKVSSSINKIWTSEQQHKWFRNGLAFFMTLFFGPILLVLVFSIPAYLQTLPYYQMYFQQIVNYGHINALVTQLIPITVSTLGLFVLYQYIPATSVHPSSAIRGAFFAALLIQGSNMLVSGYFKNFSSFDVIYGSLAIIPIFLLWVFVVWLVVLLGAAYAFIYQFHHETNYMNLKGLYNNESLLTSALYILTYLGLTFKKKYAAPNFDHLQLALGLNRKRLIYILSVLKDEGFIISYEDSKKKFNNIKYQPAVTLKEIRLQDLIKLFHKPQELEVLPNKLRKLLLKFDIHPGFLKDGMTIQELVDSYEEIYDNLEMNSDSRKLIDVTT